MKNQPGISIQRALVYVVALTGLLVVAFGSFVVKWKVLGFVCLGIGLVGAVSLATVPVYTRNELRARATRAGRGVGRIMVLAAITIASATVVEVIRDPGPPPRTEAACKFKSRGANRICTLRDQYALAYRVLGPRPIPGVRGGGGCAQGDYWFLPWCD